MLSLIHISGMIFVPSKDGISHSRYEYTAPEDIENGCNVFLKCIMSFDFYFSSSFKTVFNKTLQPFSMSSGAVYSYLELSLIHIFFCQYSSPQTIQKN